jgi:hypothetical protein
VKAAPTILSLLNFKKKKKKRAIRSGGLGKGISHECINLVLDN